MVVEVVLYTLDLLIVLVALAGNEDDIAFLSQHTGGTDSLTAVNYRQHLFFIDS